MKLNKFFLILSGAFILIASINAPIAFSQEDIKEPSEIEKAQVSIMSQEANLSENAHVAHVRILTLDRCIEIAIKNSLPLKNTKKSVKLAEWRLWEARRNLLPKVAVKIEEYTGTIYGRQFYGKKNAVDLQQTVWHGGEFLFTMKQAETNLKIANKEYSKIKNELILQVKKGYYNFIKAKENLKLQTELSGNVSKIHEMVGKQFESGVASNLEFLNVNSQANQVRFQLTSATGDLEVAELILKQAMNVDIKERLDIDAPLEFKRKDVEFGKTLADALVYRPEMQISSLTISYYMYEKKIAAAKSWPKVDFLGSFGLAKEQFVARDMSPTDDVEDLAPQWYAGVKVAIPLWGSTGGYSYTKEHWVPVVSAVHGTETITNSYTFNFLDNLAQYSSKYSSDLDYAKARQELIKTKQDVTLEVKETCFSYEKALMQLETAANKVKYQESDLEFLKFRREMDEVQDSNVIDGMIKLAQERFGYVQAMSECDIALAAISKAVGIPNYFSNDKDKK